MITCNIIHIQCDALLHLLCACHSCICLFSYFAAHWPTASLTWQYVAFVCKQSSLGLSGVVYALQDHFVRVQQRALKTNVPLSEFIKFLQFFFFFKFLLPRFTFLAISKLLYFDRTALCSCCSSSAKRSPPSHYVLAVVVGVFLRWLAVSAIAATIYFIRKRFVVS